jgi:pyridoxine/pyridoxamine 5'-phosphate oxidase
MANAEAIPEMKRSQRAAKSRNPKPQPGDWVAHPLSQVETILAVGPDMQTVIAKLQDQKIDPMCVGIYQVPLDESEFLGGAELEFQSAR